VQRVPDAAAEPVERERECHRVHRAVPFHRLL